MNKYEKAIMTNLYIIKAIFIIALILNLILSVTKGKTFTLSFLHIPVLVAYFIGYLSAMGYISNKSIILPIGLIRFCEIGLRAIFKASNTNWVAIVILVLIDIIYIGFIMFDSMNYTYERVDIDDGETY